jgi:hypothetical protein
VQLICGCQSLARAGLVTALNSHKCAARVVDLPDVALPVHVVTAGVGPYRTVIQAGGAHQVCSHAAHDADRWLLNGRNDNVTQLHIPDSTKHSRKESNVGQHSGMTNGLLQGGARTP